MLRRLSVERWTPLSSKTQLEQTPAPARRDGRAVIGTRAPRERLPNTAVQHKTSVGESIRKGGGTPRRVVAAWGRNLMGNNMR